MSTRPSPVDVSARVGPIVDGNVHLWDQSANPVFWLSERTSLRAMLGNYDALPDRYTLDDFRHATSTFDVTGLVWSDPGAADPLAAIEQVHRQDVDGMVAGIVTLADPFSDGFASFVATMGEDPLVTSVRVRFVDSFGTSTREADDGGGDHTLIVERMRLLSDAGLVATIEADASRLESIRELAIRLPGLRIVVDHFGWPNDLSAEGRRAHLTQLAWLAEQPNVATRIDAIGTVFGAWTVDMISPWLRGVVDAFGARRCILGSDMPIETLRSSFARLYGAYDAIFRSRSDEERRQLFGTSALGWLGAPR